MQGFNVSTSGMLEQSLAQQQQTISTNNSGGEGEQGTAKLDRLGVASVQQLFNNDC